MGLKAVAAVLVTASCATLGAAQQSCSENTLEVSYPAPKAADGWTYRLVIEKLARPRGILFDEDGGLVVVDAGQGLVHLELEDHNGTCVTQAKKTTLVEDEDLNHGIALSHDGKTLYASSPDSVYSWDYTPGGVRLDSSSRRTLITNMSNSGHESRTLLLSESEPGIMFVSRGSDSNEDDGAKDLDSGRSQIRSFNISALDADSKPFDYLDGDVWGWGLRNSVGVAENPIDGGLWSVENSVDQLRRDGKDIHTNNPGEELNFHGYVNGSGSDLLKGKGDKNNYGYPTCLAIWSTDNFPDLGSMTVGDQFPGQEDNGATDESCNEDYVKPRLTFQAHSAPLDIKFTKDGRTAYVSFHGSWNRDEPTGYKIVSIAFGEDGMPEAKSDSQNATNNILSTPDLSKCPDECFRPVGLAWDSKNRLWFSSDRTGEIFVMEKASSGGSSDNGGDSGASDGDSGEDDTGVLIRPSVVVLLGAAIVGLLLA